MKWLKIFTAPGKALKLLKEATEAFTSVTSLLEFLKGKIAAPEIKERVEKTQKEVADVVKALRDFA